MMELYSKQFLKNPIYIVCIWHLCYLGWKSFWFISQGQVGFRTNQCWSIIFVVYLHKSCLVWTKKDFPILFWYSGRSGFYIKPKLTKFQNLSSFFNKTQVIDSHTW